MHPLLFESLCRCLDRVNPSPPPLLLSPFRLEWNVLSPCAGLWAGIVPCLLPSFPANAVGFVLYELVVTHMVADDNRAGSVIW